MSNKCLEEFTALSFRHPPDQVAPSAAMAMGNAYCFMYETVTEAVDAFRADIPKLEAHIRACFPSIADFKHSDAFRAQLNRRNSP